MSQITPLPADKSHREAIRKLAPSRDIFICENEMATQKKGGKKKITKKKKEVTEILGNYFVFYSFIFELLLNQTHRK